MDIGTNARLDRIGTDGRIVNIPMDHGITIGATNGLQDIEATVDAVTSAGADSILTHKGLAPRVHPHKNNAGFIVHCNASTTLGPDVNDKRVVATAEEAVRVGADAVSLHINVGSNHEPTQMEALSELTREADRFGLPVVAMTYARGPGIDEHDSTNLAHAVRFGEELGADVVKTAYSGDAKSFERVVEATQCPVIVAGGEPGPDRDLLEQVRGARDAGAAGVSMGRSAFGHPNPAAYVSAVSSIVHDDTTVDEALELLGSDARVA